MDNLPANLIENHTLMDLILWRHAEAEYSAPDLARALTDKGRKQAKQMAAWLKPRLPEGTRILVSPATRAQQTADALNLDFNTLDAIAPGAPAQALLAAAGWPGQDGCVLLVGHQPSLGEAAALLLSGQPLGWSLKKGAICWIRARDGGDCQLRAALSPDLL